MMQYQSIFVVSKSGMKRGDPFSPRKPFAKSELRRNMMKSSSLAVSHFAATPEPSASCPPDSCCWAASELAGLAGLIARRSASPNSGGDVPALNPASHFEFSV